MDYYLKSTDEGSLWESLESAGLAEKLFDMQDPLNIATSDKEWTPTGKFTWISKCQIDVIGKLYTRTEEVEEINGLPVAVMQELEGYHANLRATLTEEQKALLPLIDTPTTPHRVWA